MERFARGPLTFDVSDSGPADGPVVVLLHGFPQDHTAWDGVVPGLNAAGLRTLAPDLRGVSSGARPPGRRAYTMQHNADDVLALLDAAGVERAHVVGHDWGGAIAWHLAGRNPERVISQVVLSTPHPGAMGTAMVRSKGKARKGSQLRRSWYMGALALPGLAERFLPGRIEPWLESAGLHGDAARRYAARIRQPGAVGPAVGWYRALPYAGVEPSHRSKVPTTYVWGRRDPFLSRLAAETTAKCVKAPYLFVELDAGHWIPETRADEVVDLVLARISESS